MATTYALYVEVCSVQNAKCVAAAPMRISRFAIAANCLFAMCVASVEAIAVRMAIVGTTSITIAAAKLAQGSKLVLTAMHPWG